MCDYAQGARSDWDDVKEQVRMCSLYIECVLYT
jgi:hypothetical protein